jgi:tryptophan 2,3-dioxygenase
MMQKKLLFIQLLSPLLIEAPNPLSFLNNQSPYGKWLTFLTVCKYILLNGKMPQFDLKANVFWPLAHYKSAVRYLQRDPVDIAATGGTNWQKYLPTRFQKVIFFPNLWSQVEQAE